MSIDSFSKEVQKELKFYVYGLIDPRNGKVFYVGKGNGNRVFEHIKAERNYDDNEIKKYEKIETINAIKNAGLEVIHIIFRHGMTEAEAYHVEAALIDYIPGLSNIIKGQKNDYGINNAQVLENNYSRQTFNDRIDIKYMIIKIKQSSVEENDNNIYKTVRSSWVVNKEKVDKIDYVLAVVDGIVSKVYKVDKWKQVNNSKRYEFEGNEVNDEIAAYFKNKRIPDNYRKRGSSNPVLYPPHIK